MATIAKHLLLTLVFAIGFGSLSMGCGRSAGSLDDRDARDPLVKRARSKEKARDIDGAIQLYNKALDRRPTLARAHLEVGLLYDKYREDYLRAIYHYERYIELRPQAEKRDLIEELTHQARIAYAASLPDRPSGAIDAIHGLKREVARLTRELAAYENAGTPKPPQPRVMAAVTPKPPPPAQASAVPAIPRPAPAQPQVDTYKVERGDTLSSIAAKMYNEPGKWQRIFEANRKALSTPESLRMGQTLIIPRL